MQSTMDLLLNKKKKKTQKKRNRWIIKKNINFIFTKNDKNIFIETEIYFYFLSYFSLFLVSFI